MADRCGIILPPPHPHMNLYLTKIPRLPLPSKEMYAMVFDAQQNDDVYRVKYSIAITLMISYFVFVVSFIAFAIFASRLL